ncbi:MAG: 50S ribosomal protein L13, partial [Terriglobales bacterium]
AQIRVTGLRAEQKLYHRYTGFPGGLRSESFRKRFARKPEAIVEDAIVGMLPKTKLGRAMAKKLKVYRGDKHLHQAQKPQVISLAHKGA